MPRMGEAHDLLSGTHPDTSPPAAGADPDDGQVATWSAALEAWIAADSPGVHGSGWHTGTIGYVLACVTIPVTATLEVANDLSPHVPADTAIASIASIYIRSKAAITATFRVKCYNEAGSLQWTESSITLTAAKYGSKAVEQAMAQNDYCTVDITAYTSGGEEVVVEVRGKKAVTAT